MSQPTLAEIVAATPLFKGITPIGTAVDGFKPTSRAELLTSLLAGPDWALRVAPDAKQLVQIDEFKSRISADSNGPELYHLPKENKYAYMLVCEQTGDRNRVVRTSDIHQVRLSLEAQAASRSANRKASRAGRRAALKRPAITAPAN